MNRFSPYRVRLALALIAPTMAISLINQGPAFADPPIDSQAVPSATQCKCCQTSCCTKKAKEAATKAMKSAYAGVFYDNNFAYLDDPCYNGPNFLGESLKNMKSRFGTVSLGGETRFRYHDERNFRGPNGLTGNDDNFWLFRQRLYADYLAAQSHHWLQAGVGDVPPLSRRRRAIQNNARTNPVIMRFRVPQRGGRIRQ